MKKSINYSFFALLCCIALSFTTQAQIATPQPSPAATVTQKVGLTDVTVSYSRPSLRGRKMFGTTLPYGEIWRTGANAATTFKFSDEVTIEGKKIPAGTYSVFSIPGQNEWTVMLNKNEKAGTNDYSQAEDVARFTVKPKKTASTYETFTIDFSELTNTTAMINLKWEDTKIALKMETEVDSKVMAQIKEKLATNPDDPATNFQAAVYYMETGKDLKQAMVMMNKGTAKDPQFWQLHQKARLQALMMDKKGAAETANKSIELAKKAKNNDYVRMNEQLLSDLKK
jgi:hypothetical protein